VTENQPEETPEQEGDGQSLNPLQVIGSVFAAGLGVGFQAGPRRDIYRGGDCVHPDIYRHRLHGCTTGA
jgi:hypothetical protein